MNDLILKRRDFLRDSYGLIGETLDGLLLNEWDYAKDLFGLKEFSGAFDLQHRSIL